MVRRLKAAGTHLLISLVVFTIIIGSLVYFCFPWPYYKINGLWQGLRITASVDLILGPLLTMIVFTPGKSLRALRFDLSLIAAAQITALVYGVFTLYTQRPYAVVFADNGFETIRTGDLPKNRKDWAALEKARDEAKQNPPLVAVRAAQNPMESVQMFIAKMTSPGFPAVYLPRLETVSAHWPDIAKSALVIPQTLPQAQMKKLNEFAQAHQLLLKDVALLPVHGSFGECLVAFRRDNGAFIGYLDITADNFHVAPPPKKHG